MSEAQARPKGTRPTTLDEFRGWHARQSEAWEFVFGATQMMAPGTLAHTLIKSNLGRAFGNALAGSDCRVFIDGAVVEVQGSSLIPDVVVTCEPTDYTKPEVPNPLLIVEVLSPSGEKDDLGKKLLLYVQIPSLRHYLVVRQDRPQVVHHERRDDLGGRYLTTLISEGGLWLDPPGIELGLAAIYDGLPLG